MTEIDGTALRYLRDFRPSEGSLETATSLGFEERGAKGRGLRRFQRRSFLRCVLPGVCDAPAVIGSPSGAAGKNRFSVFGFRFSVVKWLKLEVGGG